jgi:glutamate dehydrogenase (NADP+)
LYFISKIDTFDAINPLNKNSDKFMNVAQLMADLEKRHPGESEYLQAVKEVLESIEEVYNQHPEYEAARIVERIVEPDRIFTFKVTWVDDAGTPQVNIGYRVQFNSAIGPYKGGLRFHKAVNPSMLKFLGFEQTFKNALTTLPMGGAKGGSDFDPTGKSNAEIMRFCQAFMLELWHNIGVDTDVPAGDVGVGGREIGFLNGMFQKLARQYHTGVLTGKGETWGGSILRPEATGFGALYFVEHMLKLAGKDITDKTVVVSGFGNVAWGASKKAKELGAKVIGISGPDGVVHIPDGMTEEMIDYLLELRASNQNIVAPFAKKFPNSKFTAGKKAWSIKCDIALPCAFQNELNGDDAAELLKNGTWCCAEVSNMGCTPEAIHAFQKAGILFAPGKAVNAGGVATSGLEMTQNCMHISWAGHEVDEKLHFIMESIHGACVKFGTQKDGRVDYVKGANIAGFMKVAQAMLEQGIV